MAFSYNDWGYEEPYVPSGTENPAYLIFNDSIIQSSSASPRWSTVRITVENSEVRRGFRSRPLWNLSLGGCLLNPEQYEELLAFQMFNEGMLKEFLCRNSKQYLFETFSGQPSLIGIGDGTTADFQLRKERKIQGRVMYETIKYPKWHYPPLLDFNGMPWLTNDIMPDISVYVGGDGGGLNKGVKVSNLFGFEANVNTGMIHLNTPPAEGQRIEAYGGYFHLMICNQDEIPVKLSGPNFQIDSGVSFSEPVYEAISL